MPQQRAHLTCRKAGKWKRVYHRPGGAFYKPLGWVCEACEKFVTDERLEVFEPVDNPLRKRLLQRRRRGTGMHRPEPRQS